MFADVCRGGRWVLVHVADMRPGELGFTWTEDEWRRVPFVRMAVWA